MRCAKLRRESTEAGCAQERAQNNLAPERLNLQSERKDRRRSTIFSGETRDKKRERERTATHHIPPNEPPGRRSASIPCDQQNKEHANIRFRGSAACYVAVFLRAKTLSPAVCRSSPVAPRGSLSPGPSRQGSWRSRTSPCSPGAMGRRHPQEQSIQKHQHKVFEAVSRPEFFVPTP